MTITDFGHDGRIGARWNAATRTLAYGRAGKDSYFHTFLPMPMAATSGASRLMRGTKTGTSFRPRDVRTAVRW